MTAKRKGSAQKARNGMRKQTSKFRKRSSKLDASACLPQEPVEYNLQLAADELSLNFPPRGELGGAGTERELPPIRELSEAESRALKYGVDWVSRNL